MSDKSWQEQCTRALASAVAIGEFKGRTQWETFRADNPDFVKRIIIADHDFSNQELKGFNLSRCWIGRCKFLSSNLSDADFTQAIFRDCKADGANVEGATFNYSDMRRDGLTLTGVRFDSNTTFDVAAEHMPDAIDAGLTDISERMRRERLWRYRKSKSIFVRFFLWLTDYGFSFTRLILSGIGVVALFTALFCLMGKNSGDAALASVKYFLNLDNHFSDPALSWLGSFEALFGMLFFAILTTIMISRFIEKS